MWAQLLLTGGMAVAAGALAAPAARDWMLGDVEYDWVADELDLDCIEPDGQTVRTKSGAVLRVFRLRGISYDAKVLETQRSMLQVRAALLHAIGELKCPIRLFGVKRRRDISFEATWPSAVLEEIGRAEQAKFQSSDNIEWFVLISATTAKALIEASGRITAMAGDYKPVVLEVPEDRTAPCPLTSFLDYLLCGEWRELLAQTENLSAALPGCDFHPELDGRIITFVPTRHVQRVITVHKLPETVNGWTLGDVMALPGDIEISQICEPVDRDKALLIYKHKANNAMSVLFTNPALASECSAIMALLTEGRTTLFATQLQIIVRSRSDDETDRLTEKVCHLLGRRRVTYTVETVGAPTCWYLRIPGVQHRRLLCPSNIREENLAALWPLAAASGGMMESPFGDRPVRFLSTPSGQAYAFQFHVSERPQSMGNFLVFAPSGGGKSTLMMHLLGGLAKFEDIRSYIFDSKEGARFMVEAMGGIYQGYDDLQLNPLDVGEDTPKNRQRVYMVLKAMAAGIEAADDDEQAFNHAVELAFSLEPPNRTLNAIYEYAFARRTTLRRAFARWVTDGKGHAGLHAHVFNAPHDSLGGLLGASHMIGINMNEALDDPILGPPIVAHISEAISKTAATSSRGFVIFVDEAAKLLQNDGFKALAMEMYREYRKLNGVVGLAFQDPAALFRSGVAEAFLENTATLIFLPNSQASRTSLEPFNLNDEQIGFILGGPAQAGKRQALIIKRDAAAGLDESAIVDVDLRILGDALRHYRAGTDANKHLAELKRQWGDQWRTFL